MSCCLVVDFYISELYNRHWWGRPGFVCVLPYKRMTSFQWKAPQHYLLEEFGHDSQNAHSWFNVFGLVDNVIGLDDDFYVVATELCWWFLNQTAKHPVGLNNIDKWNSSLRFVTLIKNKKKRTLLRLLLLSTSWEL